MAALALVAYWVDERTQEPRPLEDVEAKSPELGESELIEPEGPALAEQPKPIEPESPALAEQPKPIEPESPALPEPKLIEPEPVRAESPALPEPKPMKPEPMQAEKPAIPEPDPIELGPPPTELAEPETPTPLKPKPAKNAKPTPSQAFLELWKRVPEFDNRLMALLAHWQSGPSPLERRRGVERLDCSVESICVSSEQRWESTIANLGVGGAEILLPDDVGLNTRLALVPKTHLIPVTGKAAWVLPEEDGYRIGLSFEADPDSLSKSWVADTLLELGSAFLLKRAPRRYVRVSTDVPSYLMTDEGRQIEVVLKDVSLGGCLLQSSEPFKVEEITLRLGSVDCRGKVVNNRECPDTSWSHHVHFAPLGPLETLRLLRTISVLLKNGSAS
jgi:hypothetical protein